MELNITINEDTSYRDLKSVVPDRSKDHTPMGKTLIKSDEKVMIRVKQDSATITVYESGWFAYEDDQERVTARAVSNCNTMCYLDALGNVTTINEPDFADLPFPIVLSHFGERNIADQINKKDEYHGCVSMNGELVRLTEDMMTPDFTESLDLDGDMRRAREQAEALLNAVPAAKHSLKRRQREVIDILFSNNGEITQDEAARLLGVGKSSLSITLKRALANLKKYYENNF